MWHALLTPQSGLLSLPAHAGDSGCICTALLYMHQAVVGVLIPTVLAACAWGVAEVAPPWQQQQRQQRSARSETLASVVSMLTAFWQQANQLVAEVFSGADLPAVQLLLAAWLLTGNLWMVAVAMAELDP